jgi:hypothetical protein
MVLIFDEPQGKMRQKQTYNLRKWKGRGREGDEADEADEEKNELT